MTSLPLPDGPVIRTVAVLSATFVTSARIARIGSLVPINSARLFCPSLL